MQNGEKTPPKISNILVFLGIGWLILNLFQSVFTDLAHDEAYYWMYGQYPAWGYFDHPLITGMLIRLSSAFIPGELGVRIPTILMSLSTLCILWKLSPQKQPLVWFAVIFSTFLVHVGGFMAAPDVPLLFSVSLFWWVFKNYLEKDSWKGALAISAIIPLILYSKYHGILLIFITLAANPGLMRRKSFWIIPVLSVIALLPQILWQFSHGLPTLHYYLEGRPSGDYSWHNTGDFIAGLILITGPIIGFLTVPAALRYSPENAFERSLKINMIGVVLFFFLFTFKGRVEANWVAQALVPLFLLSHLWIVTHPGWKKWVFRLAMPSIALIVTARIYYMEPWFPIAGNRDFEFTGWNDFGKEINSVAGEKPILANTYQMASKLSFYTGRKVPSLNLGGRPNQFDFWEIEKDYIGQDFYFLAGIPAENAIPVQHSSGKTYYLNAGSNFRSYRGLKSVPAKAIRSLKTKEFVGLPFVFDWISPNFKLSKIPITELKNGRGFDPIPTRIVIHTMLGDSIVGFRKELITETMLTRDSSRTITINYQAPAKPGKYQIQVATFIEGIGYWPFSDKLEIDLKD